MVVGPSMENFLPVPISPGYTSIEKFLLSHPSILPSIKKPALHKMHLAAITITAWKITKTTNNVDSCVGHVSLILM